MEKCYKTVKLADIKPYENNPRVNDEAVEDVKESIIQCGYIAPIIVDEDNVILAGHTRYKALKELETGDIEVLVISGLSDDAKRKYRLLDNKTTELSFWDMEKLADEIEGMDFEGYDFGFDDLFGETEEEKKQDLYDEYSKAIGTVEYEPTGEKHEISELYTPATRFDEAIDKIQNEELKEMLRIRQAWFCEFDFAKIADYYAGQATPEEQEVFEMLGLVLMDRDGLIKNGFADLLADVDGLDPDEAEIFD